jgi:hypothetical protein
MKVIIEAYNCALRSSPRAKFRGAFAEHFSRSLRFSTHKQDILTAIKPPLVILFWRFAYISGYVNGWRVAGGRGRNADARGHIPPTMRINGQI